MRRGLAMFLWLALAAPCGLDGWGAETAGSGQKKVYVLPIRDDIMPPLTYLVRRGVKQAMEAKADLLLLDMDTPGGRVDVTEEIISILNRFQGDTATYVNPHGFSAGAFIAVSTKKIYMAPQSVIGAAAPIMISPVPGSGPTSLPETMEVKVTSGIKAMMRASAEKNGHNGDVVEAMIDRSKELVIDGRGINPKGNILTLTDREASAEYGNPPKPLLSLGTVSTLDGVIDRMGYSGAQRHFISPSGAEKLASWLNLISPILLIIGAIGIYIEFKTPGLGLPGRVGIIAFALYFFGGYVAGLSGMEWVAVFILGLILLGLELFIFTGTAVLGVIGGLLMVLALVMALVDTYPSVPGWPAVPRVH